MDGEFSAKSARATSQERRTCIACASSKVKCDRKLPACGRCVRLGLSCIDPGPSRRGRAVSLGPPSRKLLVHARETIDEYKDCTKTIQDETMQNGPAGIELVREWMLIALARDSSTLFARAALMASQARYPLHVVFAVDRCEVGDAEDRRYLEVLPRGNPFAARVAGAPLGPCDACECGRGRGEEKEAEEAGAGGAGPPAKRARRASDAEAGEPADPPAASRADCVPALVAVQTIIDDLPASLPANGRALLEASGVGWEDALVWVRVTVDGSGRFAPSPTFAATVCARDAMDACYACNETSVPSLFYDKSSLSNLCGVVGRLQADVGAQSRARPPRSAKALHAQSTGGRTALRCRDGREIPCDAEWALSCYHGGRVNIVTALCMPLSPRPPAPAKVGETPLLGEEDLDREIASSLAGFI